MDKSFEIAIRLEKLFGGSMTSVGYEPQYVIVHPNHRKSILKFIIEKHPGVSNPFMQNHQIFGGIQLIFDNDLIDPDMFLTLNQEVYKKYLENKRQLNSGFVNAMINGEKPTQYFK